MRLALIILSIVLATVLGAVTANADKRVAPVIGNSNDPNAGPSLAETPLPRHGGRPVGHQALGAMARPAASVPGQAWRAALVHHRAGRRGHRG
jgi:hypothetical protein